MMNGHCLEFCVLASLALAVAGPPLAGAEGVEVDGSVRVRETVLLNPDFDGATDDANNFATMRTRVGISATIGEYASAYVRFQDSRVLGEPKDTETSLEQVDLHEGFLHVHNAFNIPLDLQLGRMEMAYGQHRQIGNQDWFDVGRAFDGALLMYDIEDFGWFHVFGMKTKETGGIPIGVNDGDGITRKPGAQNPERAFFGGYLHFDASEEGVMEAYLFDSYQDNGEYPGDFDPQASGRMLTGYQSGTSNRFTAGARLRWQRETDASVVRLYGEGAYQFGTGPDTYVGDLHPDSLKTGADIAAYAFVAGGRYGWKSSFDGWVKVEYNLASGDDEPGSSADLNTKDETKTYHQLFPSTHSVLGTMDLVGWQNIQAIRLEAGVNPDDAWKLWATYHLFSLAQPADTWYGADGEPLQVYVTAADGSRRLVSLAGRGSTDYDSGLGQEIDVGVGFEPEENLQFELQFGAWLPGKWQEQVFHDVRTELGTATGADVESLDIAYTAYLSAEVRW
jgi:hypothetical protein